MLVQTLVAKPTIERLNERIIRWLSWPAEVEASIHFPRVTAACVVSSSGRTAHRLHLLRSSFLTVEGYASDESIQIGSVKQAPYAVALAPKLKRNPLEFHGRIKLIPIGGEAGPVANGVSVQMDLYAIFGF